MEDFKLDSIEDALKDFREGKFVIVVDDEDRENEGDLIMAAEKITPEKVNFMLKNARGVLCVPITISRAEELDLPHQVSDNTSVLGTPFTVTVDKLEGCSTGVSTHDRAEQLRLWQILILLLRLLAVLDMSIHFMLRIMVFCVVRVIPKLLLTSVSLQVVSQLVC